LGPAPGFAIATALGSCLYRDEEGIKPLRNYNKTK
jgi:hypothetical protein